MRLSKMSALLLAVSFFMAPQLPAKAEDIYSANYYLEACRIIGNGGYPKNDQMFIPVMCLGQLEALRFFATSIRKHGGPRACLPKGVLARQIAKVVVAYLDRHPEWLHESFLGPAFDAVAEAWPCPQAG
jgi:hypothetical protein